MGPEDRRTLHRLLVLLCDVDAEPAARVEAADALLREVYAERKKIDALTARTLRVALQRALIDTRADLLKAQRRRRPTEGIA